jgi:hypothetical protein
MSTISNRLGVRIPLHRHHLLQSLPTSEAAEKLKFLNGTAFRPYVFN